MVFHCNPSRKHVKYSHCLHKHNAANQTLNLVTQFEMIAKHSKRRSDQVFKMSTSFYTRSSVKNMKSTADAGKRRSSSRARIRCTAQFATITLVHAHDASSSISASISDERYGISKSDEFLSLMKFDVWFCESLLHLPDSKSIHRQN